MKIPLARKKKSRHNPRKAVKTAKAPKPAFGKFSKQTKKVSFVPSTPKKPRVAPKSTLPKGFERLERYMAHAGMASRREAKSLISGGFVMVNKKIIREPGFGIDLQKDAVTLKTDSLPEKETVMLYKPRGLETNATTQGTADIASRYPNLAHLSPIGRLDKDSLGLILLSNDGTLARALTQEDSHVEKEYLVTVREDVPDTSLRRLAEGIMLDGTSTKPAVVERRGRREFSIVLTEGRKHQIRRMCDACRLTITSLERIRIGHLKSASMKPGNMKSVSPKDVERLKS